MNAKVTVKTQATSEESITPSAELIAKGKEAVDITDSRGRVITLKKPGVLSQFRLVDILGGETASNDRYMSMVLPLIFVTAIDGDQVFPCASRREIEALIQRLDEDGIQAVGEGVMDNFGGSDPEKDKAQLKN